MGVEKCQKIWSLSGSLHPMAASGHILFWVTPMWAGHCSSLPDSPFGKSASQTGAQQLLSPEAHEKEVRQAILIVSVGSRLEGTKTTILGVVLPGNTPQLPCRLLPSPKECDLAGFVAYTRCLEVFARGGSS